MHTKIIIFLLIISSFLITCNQDNFNLFPETTLLSGDAGIIEDNGEKEQTQFSGIDQDVDRKCYVPPRPHHRRLKNIIIMIADGSGYNHKTATNMYLYGRAHSWLYRGFTVKTGMATYPFGGSYDPSTAWSNFYYVTSQATDSAAAATAMSTGVKTYSSSIGVDSNGNPLKHMIEWAEEKGKATGVVTSVELSHATPAGFVAHNQSRFNYKAISREMICESAVDVIMGCGHPFYNSNGESLSAPVSYDFVGGEDTWNDLCAGIAGNDADSDGDIDFWTLIQTNEEFHTMTYGETPERVIGIPQIQSSLQQGRSGDRYADPCIVPFVETVPSLSLMTRAALNILDHHNKGFLLMVEGGSIDTASHSNQSGRMIEEEISFMHAVRSVIRWVWRNSNWEETLLIVTSDHETGYLSGPGSGIDENNNPMWNDIVNNNRMNLPGMEWNSGQHTNSLVPFFAKGRSALRFSQAARTNHDPIRGSYIDNTDIGKIVIQLLKEN